MSRILITGGSGLIGQELCKLLHQQGFEPILLSRNPAKITQWTAFEWDLDRGWVDPQLFDQPIDYLIHLAGAGIADARWSDQRKELIIDSRSQSLKILAQAFREARQELKAFISASAVGIYGDRGNEVLSEESAIHKERKDDFLVQSCIAWEDAAKAFEGLTARISHLRIGIVLSTRGGLWPKCSLLISFIWALILAMASNTTLGYISAIFVGCSCSSFSGGRLAFIMGWGPIPYKIRQWRIF